MWDTHAQISNKDAMLTSAEVNVTEIATFWLNSYSDIDI